MSSDTALILRALDYAAKCHSGQLRKDGLGTPYINHPIGVASLITNEAGQAHNVPVICAAILHDVVEDTKGTLDEIEKRFGKEIANLVGEVTDEKGLPRSARRKHRIDTAAQLSPGARIILLADKLYNCRDALACKPVGWDDADVKGYLEWVAQVVRQIRGSNDSLEKLIVETLAQGGVTL